MQLVGMAWRTVSRPSAFFLNQTKVLIFMEQLYNPAGSKFLAGLSAIYKSVCLGITTMTL